MCLGWALVHAVSIPLNVGIIWFEKNEPEAKRTLINRLGANHSVGGLAFGGLVLALIAARDVSFAACEGVVFGIHCVFCFFFFNANLIIFIRHLFVCHFRNVGILNDGLAFRFVTAVAAFLAAYYNLLLFFAGRHHNPMWHWCLTGHPELQKGIPSF